MKKIALFSVLIIALLGFSSMALAQEASVFGDQVLVRAYLEQTPDSNPATYSAYLEVRDNNGDVLPITDFIVTGVETATPTVDANPFQIHFDDLVTNDITLSYDNQTKTIYVFCTNDDPGLHVMKYDIHLRTPDPVDGVCGTELNSCTVGPLYDTADSGTNYLWDCQGENGGNDDHCSKPKPINGVCGAAVNACTAGTLDNIADSGTEYLWNCIGQNGGTTAYCSSPIPSGSVDLTVTVLRLPGVASNGIPFSGYATVKNSGTTAAGSFTLKLYITKSTDYTGAQLLENSTRTISGLAAGASTTVNFTGLTFYNVPVHSFYNVIAVADADGQVSETDEGNNTKLRPLDVL